MVQVKVINVRINEDREVEVHVMASGEIVYWQDLEAFCTDQLSRTGGGPEFLDIITPIQSLFDEIDEEGEGEGFSGIVEDSEWSALGLITIIDIPDDVPSADFHKLFCYNLYAEKFGWLTVKTNDC